MASVHTLAPNLNPEGRTKEVQLAAMDWIYRFGSTTRAFLLNDLFSPEESQGLDRTLFTQGWVRSLPCGIREGKNKPEAVLVLTEKGLEMVVDRYAQPFPYPELNWEECRDPRVNERIWTQKLTAANYHSGGIAQFWTRRMFPEDGYPYPEMEWAMRDGRILAINVDNGDCFAARHKNCVGLCERERLERRYDREVLIADQYEIIDDYHKRLKPGDLLPVWENDPKDFVPVEHISVPDLHHRLVVFLSDPWGEVLVS